MSTYTVIRADMMAPGARGWAVVDETGLRVAPIVLGYVLSWGDAAGIARALTAAEKPKPVARKSRKVRRSVSTVGDADGRNFDNLGDSPDY